MVRYFILVLVGAVCLLTACSDSSDKVLRDDPPPPSGPPIETQAQLTPDRRYVYYVHTDTAYPINSGVYVASSTNPVPYPVITGREVTYPSSVGPGLLLAFIQDDSLWYYAGSPPTFTFSGVDTVLDRAFFIEGSLVIGYRAGRIYEISNFSDLAIFHRSGTAPTPHTPGTFLWLRDEIGSEVSIVISRLQPVADSVLFRFSLTAPVHRLAHFPNSDRALLVTGSGPFSIQALSLLNGQLTTLATSDYATGLMTGFNEVVYTGPDGEFWRCDFDGSDHRRWQGTDVP